MLHYCSRVLLLVKSYFLLHCQLIGVFRYMRCSEGYCVELSSICDNVKHCRISGTVAYGNYYCQFDYIYQVSLNSDAIL